MTDSYLQLFKSGNWLRQANSETCLPEGQAEVQVFDEHYMVP